MKLHETDLLKCHQGNWILDVRFTDEHKLTGPDYLVNGLVGTHGHRLASTNDTMPRNKKQKYEKDRMLQGPLLVINGVKYIPHGWSSGHIGYFMDYYPDYEVIDPHPYKPTDSIMDDSDELCLSVALTEKPKDLKGYRQDYTYWWKDTPYWVGGNDTDISLIVLSRRAKEPDFTLRQGRLF